MPTILDASLPPRIHDFKGLTDALSRLVVWYGQKRHIELRYAEEVAALGRARDENLAPVAAEIDALLETVTGYLKVHRRSLRRKYGTTIVTNQGVTIKWRVIGRSLETPKDVKPIINWLLSRVGGKRYLRIRCELDREALSRANPKVLRSLRSFGVWAGRHEHLSLQLAGEAPIVLDRRRYRGVSMK